MQVKKVENYHIIIAALGDGFLLTGKLQDNTFLQSKIEKVSDIKILNVFILNDLIDFITADGKSRMVLHRYLPSGERLIQNKVFTVQMNTQFSCALLIDKTLIVGDTRGNLLLFDYTKQVAEQKPYQVYKVHQHERVISLFNDGKFLYSTSKDNFINQYSLV